MAQGLYKSSPVKMMGAAMAQGVGGLMGIAGGIIGGRKRRKEQRKAQREMNRRKGQYEMLDTSNLAANMENHYEDLTVNTQAADFAAQQNQQNMANIMDSQSGAAGGSGIAAMAQALAGAGDQQAQGASAKIAEQEQSNQMKAAGGAMSVQNAKIAGARDARAQEKDKVSTLLGMSQQRLGAANAARQQATQSIMGGVGALAGAQGMMMDANA